MQLRFLSRCNRCRMEGHHVPETGNILFRRADIYPCFAAAFNFVNERNSNISSINYKLIIYKEYRGEYNNFATVSKVDMCRMLNSIKQIVPFKFNFEEDSTMYTLNMHLTGTALQHKALLMLSRSLFEFPHNLCLRDALRIRDEGVLGDIDIKKYSLISLYSLCLSSFSFSTMESFINNNTPELTTLEYLRTRLKDTSKESISGVMGRKLYLPKILSKPKSTECFERKSSFTVRKKIYLHNLTANLNA